MKKTLIIAAVLSLYAAKAMAVPTCPAGTTLHAHSGSGRGGGYHTTYTCDANSCRTPWGTSVASGSSFTSYQTSSVAYPNVCVSETVSCSYGVLSSSLGYANPTCSVTYPPTLDVPQNDSNND